MPDMPWSMPVWAKGTSDYPGVYHLTRDGRRTLCLDVLVKPTRTTHSHPHPTCMSCERELERGA